MTRHPQARDDSGASLILALIVITVIATVAATLLSMADTSVRATVNLRDQAAVSYAADGAIQAAVNNIRNSTYNAGAGQHCFGASDPDASDTLTLPANFSGTASAAVSCTADPSKVLIQCPSLSHCNRPGSAILTLGTSAGEDGVNIQQPSGSALQVHGVVFSNSSINVVNGSLNTNSRVYARGACTGTVVSTPTKQCGYGATANVLGDDPMYTAATATVPVYRSLPACTAPSSVVTFLPGYYDDAAGLSDMMDGNSACKHSTWWFTPGTYYFDFHNAGSGNPLLSSADDLWTIDDGHLVAGTPVNAAGAVTAKPAVPAVIPGACDNPINDAKAVGVQFIFGGDSQLAIKSGQAEICGSYNASKPPVAVYGLTSGTATTTQLSGADTLRPTAANVSTVDGTYATWKSGKKNDSATVTLSGYAPPAAIPAGSVLSSATVRITHRHSDPGTSDAFSVTLTPDGGAPITGAVTGHAGGAALQTDTVALDSARTGAVAKAIYAGTVTGATIAVTTSLVANKDTEDIDAVQLDLSYVAPALRAGSGCVTTVPYTQKGSCALVTSVNNSGNQFYVQGTTYAPGAAVDLTLNNAAEQVFRFGVVLRSLYIKLTGSFSYTGPVIEVPDDSPGFVIAVYLTAYVCLGGGACTPATGTLALRAKVAFVDDDPTTPTKGRRPVVILGWSGTA